MLVHFSVLFQRTTTQCPLFRHVTELDINFWPHWPQNWIEILSVLIDLSQILKIRFVFNWKTEHDENMFTGLSVCLRRACHLSSLILTTNIFPSYKSTAIIKKLSLIIPRQLTYLEMSLGDIDQMTSILDSCPYLSMIKFKFKSSKYCDQVSQWFSSHMMYSTYHRQFHTVTVWMGKRGLPPLETNVAHKRAKLGELQTES